jgi:hypothetical protein
MAATDGNGRKPKGRDREPAALALARGSTVKDAAAVAGVSERAVALWKLDPPFQARVEELRAELFAAAVGRLAGHHGKAADRLGELLDSADENTRLKAARAILELGPRLREHCDLAAAVNELKRQVTGVNDGTVAEGSPVPQGDAGAADADGRADALGPAG